MRIFVQVLRNSPSFSLGVEGLASKGFKFVVRDTSIQKVISHNKRHCSTSPFGVRRNSCSGKNDIVLKMTFLPVPLHVLDDSITRNRSLRTNDNTSPFRRSRKITSNRPIGHNGLTHLKRSTRIGLMVSRSGTRSVPNYITIFIKLVNIMYVFEIVLVVLSFCLDIILLPTILQLFLFQKKIRLNLAQQIHQM